MISKELVEILERSSSTIDGIGSEIGAIIKRCDAISSAPSSNPSDPRWHVTHEVKGACTALLNQLQNLNHAVSQIKTFANGVESL
jgi:hypothetical protein